MFYDNIVSEPFSSGDATFNFIETERINNENLMEEDAANRTGVYFFLGSDPEDLRDGGVYIGLSGNPARRVNQEHDIDDFLSHWDKTIIVTTRSGMTWDRDDIEYLEYMLYVAARVVGTYNVVNINEPHLENLTAERRRDLNQFIEDFADELATRNYFVLRPVSDAARVNNRA